MATLIVLAVIGVFIAGVIFSSIGMVSIAIRREEKNLALTIEASDHLTRAGRWLNGVHVRMPRSTADAGWDKAPV